MGFIDKSDLEQTFVSLMQSDSQTSECMRSDCSSEAGKQTVTAEGVGVVHCVVSRTGRHVVSDAGEETTLCPHWCGPEQPDCCTHPLPSATDL